jgi:two-component system, chemotaxis family, sensor kinase CheA
VAVCVLGAARAAARVELHDGENDYPEVREQLKRLQGGESAKTVPGPATPSAESSQSAVQSVDIPSSQTAKPAPESSPDAGKIRILDAGPAAPTTPPLGEMVASSGASSSQEEAPATPQTHESRAEASVETVRVGVILLDKLMNLVGELVLARNQLLQFSNTAKT